MTRTTCFYNFNFDNMAKCIVKLCTFMQCINFLNYHRLRQGYKMFNFSVSLKSFLIKNFINCSLLTYPLPCIAICTYIYILYLL